MHFRHPLDLGGLYFSLNMFQPLFGLTLLLTLNLAKGSFSEQNLELLMSLTIGLGISLMLLFGTFLLLMNKEYRDSFFSMETGQQMARKNFLEGTDPMKADLFFNHKIYWLPIREKAAAWLQEGWTTWEDDKPDWFTDVWKSRIPADMKPAANRKVAAEADNDTALDVGGGEEHGRRRSVVEMISGQKAAKSKVMPAAGGEAKKEFDAAEFIREVNQRGTIGM
ncbi:hypothetical protein TrST_g7443 [Triparma strigata]|nr:hypothetical protein TrST_g7443 [Triparma strigata]